MKEGKEITEEDGIFRGLQVMEQKVTESFNSALTQQIAVLEQEIKEVEELVSSSETR